MGRERRERAREWKWHKKKWRKKKERQLSEDRLLMIHSHFARLGSKSTLHARAHSLFASLFLLHSLMLSLFRTHAPMHQDTPPQSAQQHSHRCRPAAGDLETDWSLLTAQRSMTRWCAKCRWLGGKVSVQFSRLYFITFSMCIIELMLQEYWRRANLKARSCILLPK